MADHTSGNHPDEARYQPELSDARILRQVRCESVRTSPDEFIDTLGEVASHGPGYWRDEVKSSTWAVAELNGEVIGLAGAKPPDEVLDPQYSPERDRFIESVWIAPGHRGQRLCAELVHFLMRYENAKPPHVDHFLLWVLDDNATAIAVYQKMGFEYVGSQRLAGWEAGQPRQYEYLYEYSLDLDELPARRAGQVGLEGQASGLRYRILGEDMAPAPLRSDFASTAPVSTIQLAPEFAGMRADR